MADLTTTDLTAIATWMTAQFTDIDELLPGTQDLDEYVEATAPGLLDEVNIVLGQRYNAHGSATVDLPDQVLTLVCFDMAYQIQEQAYRILPNRDPMPVQAARDRFMQLCEGVAKGLMDLDTTEPTVEASRTVLTASQPRVLVTGATQQARITGSVDLDGLF